MPHPSPKRLLNKQIITFKQSPSPKSQVILHRKKPSDIYLDTGFENRSHFSHAFKKNFGYAPTEIRLNTVAGKPLQ